MTTSILLATFANGWRMCNYGKINEHKLFCIKLLATFAPQFLYVGLT